LFYFVLEEEVDGETLFYMNDLNFLKPFKLSYKNQVMFLKEREKIFLSKTNQEKPIASSSPSDTMPLMIDENEYEVHEDQNELINPTVDSSITATTISTKDLPGAKSLPDPYLLPSLPDQVNNVINLKQTEKFEKLCNCRSIVIDAVFHDLKTKYNLL
jgi:hypothetical protein